MNIREYGKWTMLDCYTSSVKNHKIWVQAEDLSDSECRKLFIEHLSTKTRNVKYPLAVSIYLDHFVNNIPNYGRTRTTRFVVKAEDLL